MSSKSGLDAKFLQQGSGGATSVIAPHYLHGNHESMSDLERKKSIFSFLDTAHDALCQNPASSTIQQVALELTKTRAVVGPEVWTTIRKEICQQHKICSLFHQDPFTQRAFEKPRGYAGDAELLDYIYGHKTPDASCSEIGHLVYRTALSGQAFQSVKERAKQIAIEINDNVDRHRSAEILSVASGHMRELDYCHESIRGKVKTFTALDQDSLSLDQAVADYDSIAIRPVNASIRDLLKGQLSFKKQTLIYASGLFDYLPQVAAKSLVRVLFDMLNSGGSLLLANFAPTIWEVGYIEGFMEWHLIYRNEDAMRDLASGINSSRINSVSVWIDPSEAMYFLKITKA